MDNLSFDTCAGADAALEARLTEADFNFHQDHPHHKVYISFLAITVKIPGIIRANKGKFILLNHHVTNNITNPGIREISKGLKNIVSYPPFKIWLFH